MSTGAWEVIEVAASGTFGTVCVAMDGHTGSLAAIKVLRGEHSRRPRVLARARDEAAMLARIDHPSIVRVHGLEEIDGRPVLVMEWTRGRNVEQLLKEMERPFPTGVALRIARHVADALRAAWEEVPAGDSAPLRIIHRDVKPSNLLVGVDGRVQIVDFGIAHADLADKASSTLSVVLGARGYVAPERLDGSDDDPSCDTYSLGVTLVEMLTGRHPDLSLNRTQFEETLERVLQQVRPPGASIRQVVELRELIGAMCAYEPGRRPSHGAVVAQIDAWLAEGPDDLPLSRFAREEVRPRFASRPRCSLVDHPDYPDLAFLDRARRAAHQRTEPDVDARIRAFFDQPDWESQIPALEDLLLLHPHATAQPLLDQLPGDKRSWLPWGGPAETTIRRGLVALHYLRAFPSSDVRRRVSGLLRHTHPDLARHARATLESMPAEAS